MPIRHFTDQAARVVAAHIGMGAFGVLEPVSGQYLEVAAPLVNQLPVGFQVDEIADGLHLHWFWTVAGQ